MRHIPVANIIGNALAGLFLMSSLAAAADITLVDNGTAKCVVVVPVRIMEANSVEFPPGDGITAPRVPEFQRQQLRAAARDLAHYLGKMSGAKVEVVKDTAAGGMLPIYIGELAVEKFGKPKKAAPFQQGFRVLVGPQGIGLAGESDLASSYAIYEVLDRLGCRWFMPSEWGECIPEAKSIALPEMDFNSAPATLYRGIWQADADYKRRNRLGGLPLNASHALDSYISKEQRAAHPDWVPIYKGKPVPDGIKWTRPEIADAMADKIISFLDKGTYRWSASLAPEDGIAFDESEDPQFDAGDWDPQWQMNSLTDRLMLLCNRVAGRVTKKYPDVLFGVSAYVNYNRPPVREKLHPNIVPVIAPITYCRVHPVTETGDPDSATMRSLMEGWGKAARMTGHYYYAWFLAEQTAPNPMIRKWSIDVPFALKNNCQFFQPETTGNFETTMHALYLGPKLAWNPSLQPEEIINEINTRFYGNAAKEMAAYWDYVDRVWIDTKEYSGSRNTHFKRFTPERIKTMRAMLNAAKARAKTPPEKFRITMADESLILFEKYMKMLWDMTEGRWNKLSADALNWVGRQHAMAERYRSQYAFNPRTYGRDGIWGNDNGVDFFVSWCKQTYDDAARVAKFYEVLTTPPIRTWRFEADKDKQGDALGWSKPAFDDSKWRTTDAMADTWSTLGYHNYWGCMWYRTSVEIPVAAAEKKTYLWLGATDGSAKVFVNGKHIPYIAPEGSKPGAFNGYMQPASWNISGAIEPGVNQITILAERLDMNEVGTGGLMGVAAIYRER
jgi:hypothetical protein